MLSCAAGRMSQTHEWGALLLSVRVSPLCVRPRVRRGGGETVSPQHRAFCLGAERSVASVTTRAGAAVEGQRAASIVQKSCVEKGFTERCALRYVPRIYCRNNTTIVYSDSRLLALS